MVNKIYIFPRLEEKIEDLLSVSTHSSIDEMDEITTYKLGEENKKRYTESSGERFLREYRSQQQQSTEELPNRHYFKKAKRRVESSKRLEHTGVPDREDSKDSGRIIAWNHASGASIRHPPKKNDSQLSARP